MEMFYSVFAHKETFLLLIARFSGIAFTPVFNTKNIPVFWKFAVVLMLAFLAWNFQALKIPEPLSTIHFILLLASEMLVGITIAFSMQFLFAAIQLAGQLIDTQMGFGIMNVVDPLSGIQAPLIGNFKYILAILVYLQIDGHHQLIQVIFNSYELVPVGNMILIEPFFNEFFHYAASIFLLGMKLAFPLIASLIVSDVVLGIMSRTVPQMNIFMVGMPAKIIIGFIVLLLSMPLYIYLLNKLFSELFGHVYQLLKVMI